MFSIRCFRFRLMQFHRPLGGGTWKAVLIRSLCCNKAYTCVIIKMAETDHLYRKWFAAVQSYQSPFLETLMSGDLSFQTGKRYVLAPFIVFCTPNPITIKHRPRHVDGWAEWLFPSCGGCDPHVYRRLVWHCWLTDVTGSWCSTGDWPDTAGWPWCGVYLMWLFLASCKVVMNYIQEMPR